MAIIPTVRCRNLRSSISFYTRVLDFDCASADVAAGDPGFVVLTRNGDPLFLSSHSGDGVFGQAVAVAVDDVDMLFRKFQSRGLPPGRVESPVHCAPLDQSWGTREFYVDDPDGNTLRFIQGLGEAT